MAFLVVTKFTIPEGKTLRTPSDDSIARWSAAIANNNLLYSTEFTAGETTIYFRLWKDESTFNAFTTANQAEGTASEAYLTQHQISKTQQTLTI